MQFFFCGLLVAAITYFLKLATITMANIYCSDTGPPTGHRNSGPSTGRINSGPFTGRRNSGPSTGHRNNRPSTCRIINGPYTGRMIDWPNMGQTDRILAVNELELESSVHGPTITGHR